MVPTGVERTPTLHRKNGHVAIGREIPEVNKSDEIVIPRLISPSTARSPVQLRFLSAIPWWYMHIKIYLVGIC